MATQLKSGYPVTQLATQLKVEVLCFVIKLGSQKLGSQRLSGENFTADTCWLPSSGYPVKHRKRMHAPASHGDLMFSDTQMIYRVPGTSATFSISTFRLKKGSYEPKIRYF